jgi:PhoPQ-activated pathogenicity-related protein
MYTGYTLNVTSQKWLTDEDFSPDSKTKSIWFHYLLVIVPDQIDWNQNATLYITGANNANDPIGLQTWEDTILASALATANNIVTGTFKI